MDENEVELDHPHRDDEIVTSRLYNVARKVDKILNRESMADHAAVMGMIQVSAQRRSHEHEQRKIALQQAQQREAMERQVEMQRKAQFGIQ